MEPHKMPTLLRPPYIQQGDTVGIFAPAGQITEQAVNNAVQTLQSWGLKVKLGEHIFDKSRRFAGQDMHRAADMQTFINDVDIKAILCARGGYGSIRTLKHLNVEPLRKNPKWVVGFSDITVYHSLLNNLLGVESIHGAMPLNFPSAGNYNESVESLRCALFGELKYYTIPSHPLNIQGHVTGKLIGGNLSILQSIAATPIDICTDNAILFIEEVNEELYHIDRMMMNLVCAGKLNRLRAIIVGDITDTKDSAPSFGITAYELLQHYAIATHIPIAFGLQAGHSTPNKALYLGRQVTLDIDGTGTRIEF